ncbi:hypothetical protein IMSAGC008_02334 [Muribaculaceae bacterium]|nr:hypothetical protein IMSAGC008_02334 [Muribaculaceae bacterium]
MYTESLHAPMPREWEVYPPVDTAPNAWHTLSKRLIGPAHSSSTRITVSPKYISHKLLAVWLIRGCILSWVMPVTSALNICMPPE